MEFVKVVMSRRSNGLPVAIIALFLIQILSPVVQFPNPELDSKKASEASEIGFSTGSGHDLVFFPKKHTL